MTIFIIAYVVILFAAVRSGWLGHHGRSLLWAIAAIVIAFFAWFNPWGYNPDVSVALNTLTNMQRTIPSVVVPVFVSVWAISHGHPLRFMFTKSIDVRKEY